MLLFSPDAVMVSGVFAIFVANWRKLDSYWFSRPCCEIRPGFLSLPCRLFDTLSYDPGPVVKRGRFFV